MRTVLGAGLLFIVACAGGQSSSTPDDSDPKDDEPNDPVLEAAWDEILELPNVWAYRARDAYADAAKTRTVSPNGEIAWLRALGTSIPTVGGGAPADLEWQGGYDYATQNVWYKSFGSRPTYVDRGGSDEFVRFINGLPTNYETNPGQLSAAEAADVDFHSVHLFRTMPGASYEGIMAGIAGFKDRAGDGQQIVVYFHDDAPLSSSSGTVTTWGEDSIVEFKYYGPGHDGHASGDVEVFLNGALVVSGNFPTMSTRGYLEHVIGTNSHVVSNHFRALIMRRGGFFDTDELALIRTTTDGLWPRGQKPTFPYLDGQFRNYWEDWNTTTKAWEPSTGTFSGGNGIEGTHGYQWYYWASPGEPATFPRNNCLDYHLPFPGEDGQRATLVRAHYEAGNGRGNPTVFSEPGLDKVLVMRTVVPRDSRGATGEQLPGAWARDEAP